MSIINGLFSGRSGISSHGTAISVIGDNISNASTIGFKAARTEFEDLMAGGQTSGRVIGSGSQVSAITAVFNQGIAEFTGRPLDLSVDGNGLFIVADGTQRFYTRAGNFRVDASGFIVDQNGFQVLGFPSGGTGILEPLNVNTVSQSQVATTETSLAGNVNASAAIQPVGGLPVVTAPGTAGPATYADLQAVAEFTNTIEVFDSLGAKHQLTFYYFHTDVNEYTVRAYVRSDDVDSGGALQPGSPREVLDFTMTFGTDGQRNPAAGDPDATMNIAWNNGSAASSIDISFSPFTQYSSPSNLLGFVQDGQGIGTVGNINIEKNGDIFALLDNGQAAVIGRIGLVNFANPEGLIRVGNNLLQQSPTSGEPIPGNPQTGTFGAISAGSLELSTVDIATEFVKLITLQRGFQANSRIITTINQLLNDIIQLA